MARSPTARASALRRAIRALIDKLEPSVAESFKKSIDDLQSEIILKQIIDALANRDMDAAINALNLDIAAFDPLRVALTNAYTEGGKTAAEEIPNIVNRSGAEVVIRFNVANPRAERQIAELAGTEITRISEDTMLAARNVILKGYERGEGPISIGLDLAGRISKRTGRREGGIIGMSLPQTDAALSFRDRLLSASPSEMRKVLEMRLRDKRFDPAILRNIETGTPFSKADADRMYGRYVDNAIKLRGETIARTETGQAVMAASHEAFVQGLEKSGHNSSLVTRIWRSARDKKVRDSHAEMDGQEVVGLFTPFVTPSGQEMLFPLDKSLGAGPEEIINCRCTAEINLDYSAGLLPDRLL